MTVQAAPLATVIGFVTKPQPSGAQQLLFAPPPAVDTCKVMAGPMPDAGTSGRTAEGAPSHADRVPTATSVDCLPLIIAITSRFKYPSLACAAACAWAGSDEYEGTAKLQRPLASVVVVPTRGADDVPIATTLTLTPPTGAAPRLGAMTV